LTETISQVEQHLLFYAALTPLVNYVEGRRLDQATRCPNPFDVGQFKGFRPNRNACRRSFPALAILVDTQSLDTDL
jgi:hypothetical protein